MWVLLCLHFRARALKGHLQRFIRQMWENSGKCKATRISPHCCLRRQWDENRNVLCKQMLLKEAFATGRTRASAGRSSTSWTESTASLLPGGPALPGPWKYRCQPWRRVLLLLYLYIPLQVSSSHFKFVSNVLFQSR